MSICGSSNCIALSIKTYLTELSTSPIIERILNNKQKRNFLYVKTSLKLSGTLGFCNQRRLPYCIVQLVHQIVLEVNGKYVGFHEHPDFNRLSEGTSSINATKQNYDISVSVPSLNCKKPTGEYYFH